jgi:hypothetical protein
LKPQRCDRDDGASRPVAAQENRRRAGPGCPHERILDHIREVHHDQQALAAARRAGKASTASIPSSTSGLRQFRSGCSAQKQW